MQRKNDSTILILIAAGLGIYYYMRNKSTNTQSNGGGGGAYQQPEGELKDYTPNNDLDIFSPPNPSGGGGGNIDLSYLETPVGRGGGSMTDMFDTILDTSKNIDKDRFYEK